MQRLILVAMLLAIKFHDDHFFSNQYYAAVGGVSLVELNQMETEMLGMLQFRLFVSPGLFYQYVANIERSLSDVTAEEAASPNKDKDTCCASSGTVGSIKTSPSLASQTDEMMA